MRLRHAAAITALTMAWTSSIGGAPPAGAESAVGAYPTVIDFGPLARGTESVRDLGVINGGDEDVTFELEILGDVTDWVSFVRIDDPEVLQTEISVPARSDAHVGVRVAIPPDTPNGSYTGSIRALSALGGPVEPGASPVEVAIAVDLSLAVDATQRVSGQLVDVTVTDLLEVGMPLRVRSSIQNTGNVLMNPRVNLSVSRDDRNIDRVQRSDWRVEPGTSKTLDLEWDTSGLSPGSYRADVSANAVGVDLGQRTATFTVVPRGTLTRDGELTSLDIVGEPVAGGLTRLRGRFANTGEVEVRAALQVEVDHEGVLSGATTGEGEIVLPGADTDLDILVPTEQAGDYRIVGVAFYDGDRTAPRETSFTIGGGGGPPVAVFAVGGSAGIGLVTLTALGRRRRHRRPIGRHSAAQRSRRTTPRRKPGQRSSRRTAVGVLTDHSSRG